MRASVVASVTPFPRVRRRPLPPWWALHVAVFHADTEPSEWCSAVLQIVWGLSLLGAWGNPIDRASVFYVTVLLPIPWLGIVLLAVGVTHLVALARDTLRVRRLALVLGVAWWAAAMMSTLLVQGMGVRVATTFLMGLLLVWATWRHSLPRFALPGERVAPRGVP